MTRTTIEQAKAVWQIGCRVFVGDDGCRHYAAMAAEIDKLIDAALAAAESRHATDKQKAVEEALAKAEERYLKHIDEVKEESDKWEEPWVGVVDEIHQEKVNHKAALAAERLRGEQALEIANQVWHEHCNQEIRKHAICLAESRAETDACVETERRNWEAYREGEAGRIKEAVANALAAEEKRHIDNICYFSNERDEAVLSEKRFREGEKERIETAVREERESWNKHLDMVRHAGQKLSQAAVEMAYEDAAKVADAEEKECKDHADHLAKRNDGGDVAGWRARAAAANCVACMIRQRAKASPTDSRTPAHDPPPAKPTCRVCKANECRHPMIVCDRCHQGMRDEIQIARMGGIPTEATLYWSTAVGHFSGSCR